MRFYKGISLFLILVLCICCVGCKKNNIQNDTNTITIWAWDDQFNVKAAKLAKTYYEKLHPEVTVNVVSMAQSDIVQSLNTALSSGVYNGLPDIVLIEDYRVQYYLQSYPGELRDLSGVIDANNFADYKTKVMSVDGKLYGVPFDSGVAALFYRTDYLKQAGFNTEDMQNLTWDKYIEIGKQVKQKTGKNMLTLDPSDLGLLRTMLQSCGRWYVGPDGKTVDIADNEALQQAVSIYKKMINAQIVTSVSGWDSFVGAFQKGDVATVPTGCWITSSITTAQDQSGKWAIAPLPRLDGIDGAANASNIGGSGWYVLQNAQNPQIAEDFLAATFAGNTELLNELVQEIGLVSTLKSAANAPNYKNSHIFFGGQRIFEDFAKWTDNIPSVQYGLYTYNIEDILTESVQAILRGADIETTLDNAQTRCEAVILP